MDLLAVLLNYNEGEAERCLVVCSAYMPYDSDEPPLTEEFEKLLHDCEAKNFYLVIRCNSNSHHTVWGSTNCNDRGVPLLGFLNSMNLKILNQGNYPTFCSAGRLQVSDITQGSF
jgi:hypothetical protein